MKRDYLLVLSSIVVVGLAGCGESEGKPQANSQTSNLVGTEVSGVANQAGLQLGAKVGKGDLTLNGGVLGGTILGAIGTVTVDGTVTKTGNGWSIGTTFTFANYKGATGVSLSGTLTATYSLQLDLTTPTHPKITFTATVKGELTVNGAQTATVDLTISLDGQGSLTCGGTVNGAAVGASCKAPAPPLGLDGGQPQPPGADSGLPKPKKDGAPASPDLPLPPKVDQGTTPGPAPACDATLEKSACGGALAGKYVYQEACASPDIVAPLAAICAGATASNIKVAVNKGGTLTFTGPSYALLANTDVSYDLKVPAVCATLSCQSVSSAATAALSGKGASAVKVSCTGSAITGCSCSVAYVINLAKNGVLSTAGGVATLAAGEQYWYCVKGTGLLYKGKANTLDVGIAYSLGR